jgi:hypothetical protein
VLLKSTEILIPRIISKVEAVKNISIGKIEGNVYIFLCKSTRDNFSRKFLTLPTDDLPTLGTWVLIE